MKKMLSLAAMFAVLSYAAPASAELKIGGDASMRLRGQFVDTETNGTETNDEDDINFAYRLRLKAAADLGNGYFVKSVLTTDNAAGGWNTVGTSENPQISISQLYLGRALEGCHWMVGRVPLNSANNPIFDLALYPFAPVDIPVATFNMDRVYGLNYGGKFGPGEANATLVVFDNFTGDNADGYDGIKGNGIFNDGYVLHLSYKFNLGDVTVDPQAVIALTDANGGEYQNVSPNTFGANITIPAGSAKIGISGFYTVCDDKDGRTNSLATAADVDYSGYLVRLKGEVGPFMAWVDYNQTDDNTAGSIYNGNYDNLFVWAQYNLKVHESAAGTFSLTPTVRYWAAGAEQGAVESDYSRLRTELVATVTF